MVVTMCPIIISSRTRPDRFYTHTHIISIIIFIKVNKIHDLHNEPNKSITARKQDYTIKVNYNVRLIISIIITYMITIIVILYWGATGARRARDERATGAQRSRHSCTGGNGAN